MRRLTSRLLALVLLLAGCADGETADRPRITAPGAPSTSERLTTPEVAWTEEDVTFRSGSDELHGILTSPASGGPHPALMMPAESPSTSGGLPAGVSSRYQTDLAHLLAGAGYAAFRYDPPGIGESGGEPGFQSLQARADEAIAALHRVQEHPAIRPDQVGLWGISQEAWVISIAAANHPEDVAFVVAVSGAGLSVAEQHVWGVEAQSRAAGLDMDDIERATLFARLLVDWQLTEPLFRDLNERAAASMEHGAWQDFLTLVYEPDATSPAESLTRAIEILASVQDEPWAEALYLEDVVIPSLRSIPPDQIEATKATAEESLLLDPRDHLTKVTCPVLAFFGADDIVQPTERSADLYARYLDEAHNDDVTLVTLPNVGHDIVLSTPGYTEELIQWLDDL